MNDIKYNTKYVSKGSDVANFAIANKGGPDEVKIYQTGRHISNNETIWRIFGLEINQRYPTVVNLAVNQENGQKVHLT